MLDSLLLLESLRDAQRLIGRARLEVAGISALWNKLYDAQKYLDDQMTVLLADN